MTPNELGKGVDTLSSQVSDGAYSSPTQAARGGVSKLARNLLSIGIAGSTALLGACDNRANAQTAPASVEQLDSKDGVIQIASNEFPLINEDNGAIVKIDTNGEATIQYAAVETTEELGSTLGIDYLELTGDIELAQILSEGETEWMGNAKSMYEDYTGDAWRETVLEINKYSSTNFRGDIANDLIEYVPLTVERFIDLDDVKYPGLIRLNKLKRERDFGKKIGVSQEG